MMQPLQQDLGYCTTPQGSFPKGKPFGKKKKFFGHLKKIEWSVLIVHVMQYAVQVQFPFRW